MFCDQNEEDKDVTLKCSNKMISEIFSILSIIFSSLVIYITAKKTKMNIINKLILQILISEILDGINILLVIFDDAQGNSKFENYNKKKYICFTQIYISLFTCLWTLSASFFISLRIYDIIIKKNALFKKKFMEKYVLIISAGVPAVIAYIFWITQVFSQSKKVKDLSKDLYYQKYHSHSHFRHMYCWFDEDRNYAIFSLVFLLIGANIYLSIIQGSFFLKKISAELKDTNEKYEGHNLQKKIDDMEHIKKSLWIYPITAAIIWISFFIIQILFIKEKRNQFLSWLYCILISVRQIIYASIFLYTQKDIRYQFFKYILCKNKNQKIRLRTTTGIINDIRKEGTMLPDVEKIM
jgi:hypothetical protein